MILLTAQTKILLATQPADFRRGVDGLAAVCRQELAQDPRDGTLFVFINRSHTMLRVLCYEDNGFWLMTKRLSKGRFANWPRTPAVISPVLARQLRTLLSGSPQWQAL